MEVCANKKFAYKKGAFNNLISIVQVLVLDGLALYNLSTARDKYHLLERNGIACRCVLSSLILIVALNVTVSLTYFMHLIARFIVYDAI